jgi:hypothetical protein
MLFRPPEPQVAKLHQTLFKILRINDGGILAPGLRTSLFLLGAQEEYRDLRDLEPVI